MKIETFQEIISTERLTLRPVTEADVDGAYFSWMNDPEILRYMETRYSKNTKESILSFVRLMNSTNDNVFRAITLENKHVGNIRLGPINWHHKTAPIGLLVGDKNYWGKGVASEAIDAITRFAFEKLDLNKVYASCYSVNLGSAKAFQKVGFTIEGVRPKQILCEGQFIDEVMMGRIRS